MTRQERIQRAFQELELLLPTLPEELDEAERVCSMGLVKRRDAQKFLAGGRSLVDTALSRGDLTNVKIDTTIRIPKIQLIRFAAERMEA